MNEFWNDLHETFGYAGASAADVRWRAIQDSQRYSEKEAARLLPGLAPEQAEIFGQYRQNQADLLALTAQEKFQAGVRFAVQLLFACWPE